MYSVSNHSCRGKSILILVAFLHALKQVLCLYYIYISVQRKFVVAYWRFLVLLGSFLQPFSSATKTLSKAAFPTFTVPKRKNTEKAPFSTSRAASPVQRPRGQSRSPYFSFSRHYIHRWFLDPACSAHQKSMMCLKTGVFTSAYQFK